jgi:hypothetical protein
MLAVLPELNESPFGRVPALRLTLPWVVSILNEPGVLTVKKMLLELVNTGIFSTVTGNGKARHKLPKAFGQSKGLNVRVVPTGGVPCSSAVPFPLSWRLSHGGMESGTTAHVTGVIAPLEDRST